VKFSSKEDDNYIRVAGNISMLKKKILSPKPDNREGVAG
jgi:hypothetical protein